MLSPHGIPVDLLDRLVIIRTLQYVLEEIIAILNTRAKVSPAAHEILATLRSKYANDECSSSLPRLLMAALACSSPLLLTLAGDVQAISLLLHVGIKGRLLETPDLLQYMCPNLFPPPLNTIRMPYICHPSATDPCLSPAHPLNLPAPGPPFISAPHANPPAPPPQMTPQSSQVNATASEATPSCAGGGPGHGQH